MAKGSAMKMEVVAVSYSNPQSLNIRGNQTSSSIIHKPLTTPNSFIELDPKYGIKNNKSAAHNAQVYIFFAHHYDYWTQTLNIPRQSWDWCHWGENITFRCDPKIAEADFHLGDVWTVGSSKVQLQVCGARVPCFKLSWRCGQKDSWLQDLAKSGKCGVYLKVLTGGRIYPGDVAELSRRAVDAPLMDCATITRTAFADALSTRSTMDLLVDHPELLDMNKLLFRRKLSMLYDQSLVGKGSWKGWRRLSVARVVQETSTVKSFHLTADQESLAAFLPGQFLTVRLPNGLIRCWSISSYPRNDHRESPKTYRLSIKRSGKGSTWMHENCSPGTMLEVLSPSGQFCLDWSAQFPQRQVYISAGIGSTATMAMFSAHLQHQAMQRAPAIWLHISQDLESMPFRQELEDMLQTDMAQDLGVSVYLFFTRCDQHECDAISQHLSHEKRVKSISVRPGKPTHRDIERMLSEPYLMDPLKITPFEVQGRFSTIYLCGPTGFERSIRESLKKLDVPEEMALSESFSGAQPPTPSKLRRARVTFQRANKTITWKAPTNPGQTPYENEELANRAEDNLKSGPGPTLLELAEEVGLTPDFGCRTGVCGACEQKLCKGKVTAGLQVGGAVRICVARPATDDVEVDL
ncbi:PK beta-barrel-protein domain-containing protein-like protein [Sarocladium strictum]